MNSLRSVQWLSAGGHVLMNLLPFATAKALRERGRQARKLGSSLFTHFVREIGWLRRTLWVSLSCVCKTCGFHNLFVNLT